MTNNSFCNRNSELKRLKEGSRYVLAGSCGKTVEASFWVQHKVFFSYVYTRKPEFQCNESVTGIQLTCNSKSFFSLIVKSMGKNIMILYHIIYCIL